MMGRDSSGFLRHLWRQIRSDNIGDLAAMMTYYAVLAVFPLALLALTVALLVLPESVVHEGVRTALVAVPQRLHPMVTEHVDRLIGVASGPIAALGAAGSLWAGSRGLDGVRSALNRAYHVRETRPFWRVQLIVLACTLATVLVTSAALALLVLGPWPIASWLAAGALVMLTWAVLYKYLPDVDRPFSRIAPGAVFGVVVWLGLSRLFALYLQYFDRLEPTYGTLGAVVVFLLWVRWSNYALLLGGEINDSLEDLVFRRKERPAVSPPEEKPANLVRRLGDDLTQLVRDHIDLARVELARDARRTAIDVAAAALGALVAVIGFALLCATAVVALAPLLPALWLRMLLLSVVYLLAGAAVVGAFVKRLKADVPPDLSHTRDEARRTVKALKEQVTHG